MPACSTPIPRLLEHVSSQKSDAMTLVSYPSHLLMTASPSLCMFCQTQFARMQICKPTLQVVKREQNKKEK